MKTGLSKSKGSEQTLFIGLSQYLDEEKELCDELPEKCLEDLKQAKSTQDLSKALLTHYSQIDSRLIDHLVKDKDSSKLIQKILENLSPQDCLQVFYEPNTSGVSSLELMLKEGSHDKLYYLIKVILNHPDFDSKFDLLTKSTLCNERFNHLYSSLTCLQLSMEEKFEILNHFKDQEKKELVLAFEGGSRNSNLLLLAAHGGYLEELLQLFSSQHLQEELRDYVKTYYQRKKAAHILGMADNYQQKVTKQFKGKTIPTFEGMYDFYALPIVREALNTFKPSDNFTQEFNQVREAFDFIRLLSPQKGEYLGRHVELEPTMLKDYLKRYQEGKLIVIPSGWPRHSVSIAAISTPGKGDFLIVGNRGEGGHLRKGCVIYELEQPLTSEDIQVFVNKVSQTKIQERIKKVAKKDAKNQPIFFQTIATKQQARGTCTTANKKALVGGLLALLKHLNSSEFKLDEKMTTEVLSSANKEYKKFTAHARYLTIADLIVDLKAHVLNNDEILQALAGYCNQHIDIKKQSELELLERIFKEIPEHSKEAFLDLLKPQVKVLLHYINNHGISSPLPNEIKYLLSNILSKEETQKVIQFLLQHQKIPLNQQDLEAIINNFYFKFYTDLIVDLLIQDQENKQGSNLIQFLELCSIYPNLKIANKPLSDILKVASKQPRKQIEALGTLLTKVPGTWSNQAVKLDQKQSIKIFHYLLEKVNISDITNKEKLETILKNFDEGELIAFAVFQKEPSISTTEELKQFLEKFSAVPDLKIGRHSIAILNQLVQKQSKVTLPVTEFPPVLHTFHLGVLNRFTNCQVTASYKEGDNVYVEYSMYPLGGYGSKLKVHYDSKDEKLNVKIDIIGRNDKTLENGKKLFSHFFDTIKDAEKEMALTAEPEILANDFFHSSATLITEFAIAGDAFKMEHDLALELIEASISIALFNTLPKRYLKIIFENSLAKNQKTVFDVLNALHDMELGRWDSKASQYLLHLLIKRGTQAPNEQVLQKILNKLSYDAFEQLSASEVEKFVEKFHAYPNLTFDGKPIINILLKNKDIGENVIIKIIKNKEFDPLKISPMNMEDLYFFCFENQRFKVIYQLMKKNISLPDFYAGDSQTFNKFLHYLSDNHPMLYRDHFKEIKSFVRRNFEGDSKLPALIRKLEKKSKKRSLTFDFKNKEEKRMVKEKEEQKYQVKEQESVPTNFTKKKIDK